MRVAVDETRQYSMALGLDVRRWRMPDLNLRACAHAYDRVTLYGDCTILEDAALRIHRHQGAPSNYQVYAHPFLLRNCRCGERTRNCHQKAETPKLPFHRGRSITLRMERISEAGRVKRFGEKVAHWQNFRFAFQIGKDDGNIAAEFPDELAAGAAGSTESFGVRYDGDGIEAALAFADSLENSDTFGANGQAIRCIFDIAAAEDSSGGRAKSGAYPKIRIGRMGILARLLGCGDQMIVLTHAMASDILGITARSTAMN